MFIYSFLTKPKHVFLVHGEHEGQIELKRKIQEDINIPVSIPAYGEKYELDDKLEVTMVTEVPKQDKFLRLRILERMATLKEEIEDMSEIVRTGMLGEDAEDEKLHELNDKIKELEKQIIKIIEE